MIRNNTPWLLTVALVFLFGLAKETHAQTENGRIYFLRSTGYVGSAGHFTTFIDGEFVCKLNNKRFSMHVVPAGSHLVSVQISGKDVKEKAAPLAVTVEPGKSCYVQLAYTVGTLSSKVGCVEVTENSALPLLKNLKEDTKCQ